MRSGARAITGVSSARSAPRLTVSLQVSALAGSQKDDAAARPKRRAARRTEASRAIRIDHGPPRCLSKRVARSVRGVVFSLNVGICSVYSCKTIRGREGGLLLARVMTRRSDGGGMSRARTGREPGPKRPRRYVFFASVGGEPVAGECDGEAALRRKSQVHGHVRALREMFEQFGAVTSAQVLSDRERAEPRIRLRRDGQ